MITQDMFTRVNNDINGNPRYYISVSDFFTFCPSDITGILNKAAWCDKKRKGSGLNLYRGKAYGSGYVIQSYNLQSQCDYLNEFFTK